MVALLYPFTIAKHCLMPSFLGLKGHDVNVSSRPAAFLMSCAMAIAYVSLGNGISLSHIPICWTQSGIRVGSCSVQRAIVLQNIPTMGFKSRQLGFHAAHAGSRGRKTSCLGDVQQSYEWPITWANNTHRNSRSHVCLLFASFPLLFPQKRAVRNALLTNLRIDNKH